MAAEVPPSTQATNPPSVLNEQLLEQIRREVDATAATNVAMLAEKLQEIERRLTDQRNRELSAAQSSNQLLLSLLGGFAALGIGGLLLLAWIESRTLRRLSESLPVLHALPPQSQLPAPASLTALTAAPMNTADHATTQFQEAIDRLTRQLRDLEQSASPAPAPGTAVEPGPILSTGEPVAAAPANNHDFERLSALLGKGLALLNLGRAEEALGCFDEAVRWAPQNAEAHLKRGTALEQLKRLEEAVACYDRAIALDGSLTMAFLHKGGACNRLSRFQEALESYERAVQTGSQPGDS